MFRTYVAAALCSVSFGNAAMAQSAPAEFPPESFTGNQYIDSNGCAFIRAGISGVVNWIPRMNRQREPLCGFEPTFGGSAPVAEAEAEPEAVETAAAPVVIPSEPAIVEEAEAAAPVVAAAATLSTVVEAQAEAEVEDAMAPIETVASIPATPVATTVQPTTPAIVQSASVVSLPAAVIEPVTSPTPRTMTRAAACDGRTGVIAGFVTASGAPLDCGPAAAPAPRRVTLSEICAEIATTGQTFINQATGQPVDCPGAAPATTAATAPVATATATATRSVTRLFGGGIPASNPVGLTARDVVPTPGYRNVWDDGRVNPNRGLPPTTQSSGAAVRR